MASENDVVRITYKELEEIARRNAHNMNYVDDKKGSSGQHLNKSRKSMEKPKKNKRPTRDIYRPGSKIKAKHDDGSDNWSGLDTATDDDSVAGSKENSVERDIETITDGIRKNKRGAAQFNMTRDAYRRSKRPDVQIYVPKGKILGANADGEEDGNMSPTLVTDGSESEDLGSQALAKEKRQTQKQAQEPKVRAFFEKESSPQQKYVKKNNSASESTTKTAQKPSNESSTDDGCHGREVSNDKNANSKPGSKRYSQKRVRAGSVENDTSTNYTKLNFDADNTEYAAILNWNQEVEREMANAVEEEAKKLTAFIQTSIYDDDNNEQELPNKNMHSQSYSRSDGYQHNSNNIMVKSMEGRTQQTFSRGRRRDRRRRGSKAESRESSTHSLPAGELNYEFHSQGGKRSGGRRRRGSRGSEKSDHSLERDGDAKFNMKNVNLKVTVGRNDRQVHMQENRRKNQGEVENYPTGFRGSSKGKRQNYGENRPGEQQHERRIPEERRRKQVAPGPINQQRGNRYDSADEDLQQGNTKHGGSTRQRHDVERSTKGDNQRYDVERSTKGDYQRQHSNEFSGQDVRGEDSGRQNSGPDKRDARTRMHRQNNNDPDKDRQRGNRHDSSVHGRREPTEGKGRNRLDSTGSNNNEDAGRQDNLDQDKRHYSSKNSRKGQHQNDGFGHDRNEPTGRQRKDRQGSAEPDKSKQLSRQGKSDTRREDHSGGHGGNKHERPLRNQHPPRQRNNSEGDGDYSKQGNRDVRDDRRGRFYEDPPKNQHPPRQRNNSEGDGDYSRHGNRDVKEERGGRYYDDPRSVGNARRRNNSGPDFHPSGQSFNPVPSRSRESEHPYSHAGHSPKGGGLLHLPGSVHTQSSMDSRETYGQNSPRGSASRSRGGHNGGNNGGSGQKKLFDPNNPNKPIIITNSKLKFQDTPDSGGSFNSNYGMHQMEYANTRYAEQSYKGQPKNSPQSEGMHYGMYGQQGHQPEGMMHGQPGHQPDGMHHGKPGHQPEGMMHEQPGHQPEGMHHGQPGHQPEGMMHVPQGHQPEGMMHVPQGHQFKESGMYHDDTYTRDPYYHSGHDPDQLIAGRSRTQCRLMAERIFFETLPLDSQLMSMLSRRLHGGEGIQHLQHIRHEQRLRYEQVMLLDPDFSNRNSIEQVLWKNVHYQVIEVFRRHLGDEDLGVDMKEQLLHILSEGTAFYENLIHKLQTTYVFRLEQFLDSSLLPPENLSRTVKLALLSTQRSMICLGDLARYKEQANETANYGKARSWYMKAQQIAPKNGRPYNQLAILALYTRHKLDAVYYYMRSLAASNPFLTARESLMSLFEEARRKAETVEKKKIGEMEKLRKLRQKRQQLGHRVEIWIAADGSSQEGTVDDAIDEDLGKLSAVELNKRFVLSFLNVHGKLFTRIGWETFPEICSQMLLEVKVLLQHSPSAISNARLLQLMAINMFSIENTSLKDESIDGNCRSLLQEHAVQLGLDAFGILAERWCDLLLQHMASSEYPCQLFNEDLNLLFPGIKVWCDWMSCHSNLWNPPPNLTDPELGPEVQVWKTTARLCNILNTVDISHVKLYNTKKEGCDPVILSEDTMLSGFVPLLSVPTDHMYVHSTVEKMIAKNCHRIQKVQMFGEYLCGVEPPMLAYNVKTREYYSVAPSMFSMEDDNEKRVSEHSSEDEDVTVESEEELSPSPNADVTHVRHLRAKKEHLEKQMEQKMKHRQNVQAILDTGQQHYIELEIHPVFLVSDTNCFIDHLPSMKQLIQSKLYTVVIPLVVINELDGLSKGSKEGQYDSVEHAHMVKRQSAAAVEMLEEEFDHKNAHLRAQTAKGSILDTIAFRSEDSDGGGNNDDVILSCCIHYCQDKARDFMPKDEDSPVRLYRDVVLLTDDRNLCLKAHTRNVPVKDVPTFLKWSKIT